jgi:hypothetical protein
MPRRRPRELRRLARHRPSWHDVPHVPGLPAFAQQEVHQIELRTVSDWARFGLWPGAVGEALAGWSRTSRSPVVFEFHPCGCCGRSSRQILDEAMALLSSPSASALEALVRPLDEAFLRRSLPDPHAPCDWPWWQRRCDRRR